MESATHMLGMCPLLAGVMPVAGDCEPELLLARARERVARLDSGDGVLVLTDMYGSTPSNIASSLADGDRVKVISGVNLPMLVRVMNYPELSLADLAVKAETGGRDGIFHCLS